MARLRAVDGWLSPPEVSGARPHRSHRRRGGVGAAAWLIFSLAACATYEARSPYLQQGAHDSVVIAWRSEEPAVGRVAWGTAPDSPSHVVGEGTARRDHLVRLEDLPPGRRIYYGWADGDAPLTVAPHQYYDPAPPPGEEAPVRFWVLGDSGKDNPAQHAVADAIRAHPATPEADFLIHVGDIAYENGSTRDFDRKYFGVYADLLAHLPVYPALGNHELDRSDAEAQTGPWFEAFVLPARGELGGVPSGTEAYYSFDHGPVHVVVLDSAGHSLEPGSRMLAWLEEDLAESDAPWTVAVFHHPPYSRGTHDSDREGTMIRAREHLVPILEAHGVDLVLSGHSHSYERTALLAGAYHTPAVTDSHVLGWESPYEKRPGPRGGTVYVVAGHGGAGTGGDFDHPLVVAASKEHGAVLVEIEGTELRAQNVLADGTVQDEFRIRKLPAE
jgi:hypothetical protein